MKKYSSNLIVIISIVLHTFVLCQCQEVPSFRIVAPQNLCKPEGNETVAKQADGVAIAFQPKDGIKMSYKFKIFFKILGPEPLTQRETLLVWKAVRALEKELNVMERLQISKDNMAVITKSQVVPGVSYIFHVIGITDAGETTREQVFTIEYADGVLQNSDVPEGINFLLLGSEEIVANMEYNVVAMVTFCKPKYNYFIQWKLDDIEDRYKELENTISSTLIIPANVLPADRKTSVEAQVREWESRRLLARDILMVEVLSKGFQAMIIPTAARIGEGSKLIFRIFLKNFDLVEETIIKWLLRDSNSKAILKSQEDNENEFRVKFEKPGEYQVSANITINGISSTVKSEIEVISSLFISYDFQDVPNLNPSSTEEFKFSVMVMNLVANCEASWLSAQEDGFQFIASGVLDKEYYGYTKVSDLEKYYLEEIIDFTNSTVNREITLHIPRREIKNELNWPGFEGDAMYKFRLDVTCPKPYVQSELRQEEDEALPAGEEPWERVVTSYFTIDLHTNSPPQSSKLLVQPLEGVALKTTFNMNSQEAKDLLLDSPVRYELKVLAEEFVLSFGKYFEYKTWHVMLPYTEHPLGIMVEICDIRQACSRVKNDTQLLVHYEHLSDEEYEEYLKKVNSLFMRTDYEEAFNCVIIALITFRNGKSLYSERFQSYAKVLINKEIDKLLEQPENQIYISPDMAHLFVEKSKAVLDYTQQMDRSTIEKLIEILDNLMDTASVEERRFKRDALRVKRIVNHHSQDLYQKTQLNLLEDLLKTEELSAETINLFIEKISILSQKMCLNDRLPKESSLKSSMVSLSMKKMKGDMLQQYTTTQITDDVFDKLVLQFKAFDPKVLQKDSKYCLVIKSFIFKDYTQDDTSLIQYSIYEILDNFKLKELQLQESNSNTGNIQLDIYPSEQRINKCLMKTSYTAQWSSDACKSVEIGKMLRCSCSQTGFLKTTLVTMPPTTTSRPIISSDVTVMAPITFTSPLPTFVSLTTTTTTAATTTAVIFPVMTNTPPTTAVAAHSTTSRTSSNIQVKPTTSMQDVRKASPMSYVIPLIFILVLLILGLLFFIHRRRMQQATMLAKSLPVSTILEYRKPATGIKYANIQDEHMLSGNF